jgi:acyl-CoA thioester hydrolase
VAHRVAVRVYYEDTDLAGIVYYANYLKFIERGRTEALRAAGIDQGALRAETGLVFVVRRLSAEYRRAARFDDLLSVETDPPRLGRASVEVAQRVLRGEEAVFEALVGLALVDAAGRPRRPTPALAAALARMGGET